MTADDSWAQAIKQAALTMAYSEGTVNAPKDGKFWRLAEALETEGLLAGTANTTEAEGLHAVRALAAEIDRDAALAEAAKLQDEREKLQADRKRWNEFDLKTVQRFESERDQARADLAALRDKVRALHTRDCAHCDRMMPCPMLRALLTDGGQS